MVGLALTAILILGGIIAQGARRFGLRCSSGSRWACRLPAFFQFGIDVILSRCSRADCWSNAVHQGRPRDAGHLPRCAGRRRQAALPVGIACALVGIIIGAMTLTGAATTFGQFIVSVGRDSLFLSLILTMVTCLVLGMGIPTIPNYIITCSIAGPALLELGVPLIVCHMFVFYFGILADLTPPVALACFAAAPIAKESGFKIVYEAVKSPLAGFVIPFMAVYKPALMLQDGGPLAAEWASAGRAISSLKACSRSGSGARRSSATWADRWLAANRLGDRRGLRSGSRCR